MVKKMLIGVAIASVVLYVWGFMYWAMGPYPTMIWKQSPDDVSAGKAMVEHFPERGTYFLPAHTSDMKKTQELFQKGPIAMVHVLSVEGRNCLEPRIMVFGFGLNVVVLLMIGVLLQWVSPALPTYFSRVGFAAFVGLTGAVFIDVGSAVWWEIPLEWKLYEAGYDVSFWILAGAIQGAFVTRNGPKSKGSHPTNTQSAALPQKSQEQLVAG